MFRLGLLIRALPSIMAELIALVWHAFRTGDRATAGVALAWLTSTAVLISFTVNGVMTAANGGEVQLRGPMLAASLPISMWLAREIISIFLSVIGRLVSVFRREPVDLSL